MYTARALACPSRLVLWSQANGTSSDGGRRRRRRRLLLLHLEQALASPLLALRRAQTPGLLPLVTLTLIPPPLIAVSESEAPLLAVGLLLDLARVCVEGGLAIALALPVAPALGWNLAKGTQKKN